MYSLTAKYNLRCGHAARYLILMYAPSEDNIMRMRATCHGLQVAWYCHCLILHRSSYMYRVTIQSGKNRAALMACYCSECCYAPAS